MKIEVLVCDCCGKPAVATREIDLCNTHRRSKLAVKAVGSGRPRASEKEPATWTCPFCKEVRDPRGKRHHVRKVHPAEWELWDKQNPLSPRSRARKAS